jgi:hypothetical protein
VLAGCDRRATCYDISTPAPFLLTFNQMYYPGWSVRLNKQPAAVRPEGIHGLIALDVPAGTHTLSILYAGTTIQHGAELISLGALAVLTGLFVRGRRRVPVAITAAPARRLALVTGAVIVGFTLLHQAYLLPATDFLRPPGDPQRTPAQQAVDVRFGAGLALVGYDLSTATVRPGDTLQLRLYWRLLAATDISPRASVQITDVFGTQVLARADSISIAGQNFAAWPPGKYATDTYTLTIAPDAPPYVAQIRVAVYVQSPEITYYPAADGRDYALLGELRIAGDRRIFAEEALQPAAITYADAIRLEGYTWQREADGRQCLGLRWQALRDGLPEYAVLLHLLAADGTFITALDAPPLDNRYPTSRWTAGQTLDDRHCFTVPPAAARLAVGFYDRANPVAVPASSSTGPLPDQVLRLTLP